MKHSKHGHHAKMKAHLKKAEHHHAKGQEHLEKAHEMAHKYKPSEGKKIDKPAKLGGRARKGKMSY